MKTTKNVKAYMISALILLGFIAWIGPSQEEVLGTWKGTGFNFEQHEGPELPALEEGGKSIHLQSTLTLSPNKTYQMVNPDGSMNGKGIWKLEDKVLTLTDERQNVIQYEIVSLEKNRLTTSHSVEMETPEGKVAGRILLTYSR
ncbi:copper resistance protein NlpE [Algoriphagus marincola]|uniref:Copper resistance protein NlpE n=1 Tax=Algoriphagus marincola TaxID=264027 RepID=A0ABS7N053_9BACT|nr:lipocalin family protein [Algoriphagus marincola]MBY5949678.1 copper resistance protein NlpE [Algoriphagus marincola]